MKLKAVLCSALAAISLSAYLPAHALMITAVFDPSYNAQQQATVNNVISYYESILTDNVAVKIQFGLTSGLGSSLQYIYGKSYSTIYNALSADRTSSDDNTAVSHISSGSIDPFTGANTIFTTHAQCAALGLDCGPASSDLDDGMIGINLGLTDSDRSDGISAGFYDMYSVVAHEIDEILGVGGPSSGLGRGFVGVEDLFRCTGAVGNTPGARTFTTSGDNAYFSIDGCATDIARFNQDSRGDYADWWSIGAHTPSPQDAFGTPGVQVDIGIAELTALDVVGWNLRTVPEPSTYSLLFVAMLGLWVSRRRSRAKI
jgi:hypothetical protein